MEETVNKNIEKYQTPSWRAHPSMIGNISLIFVLLHLRMVSDELSFSSC